MGNFRFLVTGNKIEVINIKKGRLFAITPSEVQEIIEGLQSVELPTCNNGHVGCDQHHTNWG